MAMDPATGNSADDEMEAAMAAMGVSDSGDVHTIAEDDWGAALAEQTQAESSASALQEQTSKTAVFNEFSANNKMEGTQNDIDFILDIPVQLTVELGRTKISIKNLLQLAQGSVVELDGMAGEPMDVLVNGCLIAQGEVVVVNDKFGIRLTDIITPAERIRKLNR
ncbi:flagellar motor switch protein FliN [Methylophilus flavus]|jgi:flagellar motor switch protein FliN|uniref:Flagellar motor switch protein FliN n=1 Tax=Methylophilus flavus TaxID=640084 RepID=A0ABW3P894_9PROT